MQDTNGNDHSLITHSAKCDEEGCNYVAETHAHDDDTAVENLSQDLANHNQSEHGKETKAEEIKDDVKGKMETHS